MLLKTYFTGYCVKCAFFFLICDRFLLVKVFRVLHCIHRQRVEKLKSTHLTFESVILITFHSLDTNSKEKAHFAHDSMIRYALIL